MHCTLHPRHAVVTRVVKFLKEVIINFVCLFAQRSSGLSVFRYKIIDWLLLGHCSARSISPYCSATLRWRSTSPDRSIHCSQNARQSKSPPKNSTNKRFQRATLCHCFDILYRKQEICTGVPYQFFEKLQHIWRSALVKLLLSFWRSRRVLVILRWFLQESRSFHLHWFLQESRKCWL